MDQGAVFSYAGQKSNGIDVVFGENVETIPYGAFSAFSDDDAPKIVSVTIPDSVTSIGERAFFYCTGLTSISIPDSVTSIGEMAFFGCTGLKNVTMSKSIEKIGYQAFNETALSNDETNLENGVLYIGNALVYTKNLTNSEYTIKSDTRCIADYTLVSENLKSISVDSNSKYYSSVDGVLYNKEKTTLIQYPCGNEKKDFSIPDGVTSVGNYAFYNCTGLTSITIPNSVTSIGEDAFDYCNSLKKVYITDLAAWCNIKFNDYDSTPLTKGASLYINGEIATDITIPNSVTSIGEYTFSRCTSLTSVTIPDSVTSIGYFAFSSCTSLKNITIPKSVTSIGGYAFSNCSKLSTIYYTGTESEWKNIVIDYGNDYLKNATIVYITIYTFETNGGSAVSSVTKEVAESPVTTCEGKIFLGWYDNAECSGTAITFPYSGEKTTLYAKWGAKITYTGDLDSEQIVDCGSDTTLPTAPEGYIYKFTADGEEWDGTNITSDVTVTVTKLCDKCEVVEIGDCYDIAANDDTLNVSTYFGKIFCDEISVSEGANVKVYSTESCTGDSLEYINITGNSAVVYMVVTAESGRTQTYKVQFLRTAVDLGQIEYTDDRDGLIILKLKKAAPGEPKIYIAYSKDGTDYTYAEAEYKPETLSIQLSGLEGQTKYFVKVAADYRLCSGEYAESNVIEIITKKVASSACEITKIISPPSAVFNQETTTITATVANVFSEYQINVEVSEGATWGVYRTASAQTPLSENKLTLYEGRTTKAYIRVVAEDGESTKTYTITIYRQKKSALPEISYTDGKVTITAPEGSTILYTTDNKNPIPGVYGNAYTGTFTAEIGSIVKAIALNPDAEEYSDVATFQVADDTEITAEMLYVCVNGTNVDFDYYLQTNDRTNLNGTFYLAAYNDEDVLVGLYTKEVKEEAAEYDLSGAMTVSESPAYFKAFFWGGESGMKPLRNNVTKDKDI